MQTNLVAWVHVQASTEAMVGSAILIVILKIGGRYWHADGEELLAGAFAQ